MPTDGVADYCAHLCQALETHGIELRLARVEWRGGSWLSALRTLFRESRNWRRHWVILQYTAFAWSRRGFPIGALVSFAILRYHGAKCAVVFHEPWGTTGPRLIDRIRCAFQNWTVRALHRFSPKGIFTVPLQHRSLVAATSPETLRVHSPGAGYSRRPYTAGTPRNRS